ncbi:MAG TPA: SRPBCC family protein [Ardenticatenaceae bacterium]|jgi:uncharacterized membrane protein
MADNSDDRPDKPKASKGSHIVVERSMTINRPLSEVYSFWRDFENLPRFMNHLQSVTTTGDGRSHWVLKTPLPIPLEWDAELTQEKENELIAWRSLPDSTIENRGSVRFRELPYDRGTEVKVTFAYDPPGGIIGEKFAQLANGVTAATIEEDIRHLKQILEAGEIPTNDGQPRGGQ